MTLLVRFSPFPPREYISGLSGGLLVCWGALRRGNAGVLKTSSCASVSVSGLLRCESGGEDGTCGTGAMRDEQAVGLKTGAGRSLGREGSELGRSVVSGEGGVGWLLGEVRRS